jgi:cobyrinic acid a,c-diamide synthase
MCGARPGRGVRTGRLVRFGYLRLRAQTDSLLFRRGEEIPAHEFHYWDSTRCGEELEAKKANGKSWRCGVVNDRLYAAFPHLHFGGELPLAERFVKACLDYGTVT